MLFNTLRLSGIKFSSFRFLAFSILLFFFLPARSHCQYFYHNYSYGSEAVYNPVSLILNGSYDIIQLDGYSRRIFSFPYQASSKNIIKNLTSPLPSISRYGWDRFIKNEILPINWSESGRQWWPNYQLHLIGGGMTYTMTKEWYRAHDVPSPALFSIATMASYHLLNEFVENANYEGDNVDPIADIYFFDMGGIILFSFESINTFFSDELHLADWSLQPSFAFSPERLYNNGQYFSIKWKTPFSEQWSLFYQFGMNGLLGASCKLNDSASISIGAGMRAKHLVLVDPTTNQKSGELTWDFGIFYDWNNSLMTSLRIEGMDDNLLSLNIYPGLVRIGLFSPGFWMVLPKNGSPLLGISTVWAPGVGVGRE